MTDNPEQKAQSYECRQGASDSPHVVNALTCAHMNAPEASYVEARFAISDNDSTCDAPCKACKDRCRGRGDRLSMLAVSRRRSVEVWHKRAYSPRAILHNRQSMQDASAKERGVQLALATKIGGALRATHKA